MISNFPSGWKELRLSELGVCIRGVSYDPDVDLRERDSSDTARLLRSNNVQDGSLNLKSLQFVSTTRVSSQQNMTSGDVLICMANGSKQLVGKAARFDIKGAHKYTFGAFMGIFRPLDKMDSDFIFFLMQSKKYRDFLDIVLSGSSINNLRPSNILEMTFLIPERDERRKISDALVDMDLLVKNLDKLIAKKRDIKQGAMQQLLTGETRLAGFSGEWLPTSLKLLGSVYGGLSGKSKEHFGSGRARYIPFVNMMANIRIDPRELEQVDVSENESQNSVRSGDLIFNGSSETPEEVGLCSVVDYEPGKLYLNSFCFGFHPFSLEVMDPVFYAYLFRSSVGRQVMVSLAQGSTRYNLSKPKLLAAELLVPTKGEQSAIAEVLSDMDAEIDALVARREKTALIKTGMLQELLTGRTRLL